jgi:hypothetical protein
MNVLSGSAIVDYIFAVLGLSRCIVYSNLIIIVDILLPEIPIVLLLPILQSVEVVVPPEHN